MARLPRLTAPGYPHHLILRGNNRQAIFHDKKDRELLLQLLAEHAKKNRVAVHSYVLMDNHLHLLATPEEGEGIPLTMQGLGRTYVRKFNQKYQRTGTLFEGRYKSSLIQTDRYLLACMVYIDLNPVRAGMVADPADYPWSSHLHYLGRRTDPLVQPHPLWWALGNTPFAREAAYESLIRAGIGQDQQRALTQSALSGFALGDPEYLADLQKRIARRLTAGKAGRPLKKASSSVPD